MKIPTKAILAAIGLSAGLSLISCVAPYDNRPLSTTRTVTTYQPGYTVNSLPRGYRSERISGRDYYYNNGAYYQRSNNKYVVVKAPRDSRYYNEYSDFNNRSNRNRSVDNRTRNGRSIDNRGNASPRVVRSLPQGYQTVDYRGTPYYRHQGNYYRRQGNGFVTVANPF